MFLLFLICFDPYPVVVGEYQRNTIFRGPYIKNICMIFDHFAVVPIEDLPAAQNNIGREPQQL